MGFPPPVTRSSRSCGTGTASPPCSPGPQDHRVKGLHQPEAHRKDPDGLFLRVGLGRLRPCRVEVRRRPHPRKRPAGRDIPRDRSFHGNRGHPPRGGRRGARPSAIRESGMRRRGQFLHGAGSAQHGGGKGIYFPLARHPGLPSHPRSPFWMRLPDPTCSPTWSPGSSPPR